MTNERDAEQRELEGLRALASGQPSAPAWSEITAALARHIKRDAASKALSPRNEMILVMELTTESLRELQALPPSSERSERARAMLGRIERVARSEYERFDLIISKDESWERHWQGAFSELDALMRHWPDALRVLGAKDAALFQVYPESSCWTLFRNVDLETDLNIHELYRRHPHLTFTFRASEFEDANADMIPAIRALDLSGQRVDLLLQLARHPGWSGLRSIRLYNMSLGVEHILAMSEARMFEGLETLSLRSCALEPHAVAELVEHLDPGSIDHLDLAHNPLGAAGLKHLLSLTAARPTHLDLTRCDLDSSCVARLSRARFARDTLHLGLSDNPVGDAGVAAIADSSSFIGLRALELRRAQLNDDAASALAESVHLLDLRELDVRDNRLTQPGLVSLATSPNLDRLERLHVLGNHLDQRTWLRLIGDEVAHAPLRAHLASQRGC